MKLYMYPGACSLSPHIVLEELGIDYQTEKVDLATKLTESGEDFTKINPKGYVPALQLDDGEVLTEGPAIVQYLADLHPDAKLVLEPGSMAHYQLQSWLTFIGTELHKSCGVFFNPAAQDDWRASATAMINKRLSYVDTYLAGNDYLLGEHYSVADAYLFTVLSWLPHLHIDMQQWENLARYYHSVAGRPAVGAVLKAESLV